MVMGGSCTSFSQYIDYIALVATVLVHLYSRDHVVYIYSVYGSPCSSSHCVYIYMYCMRSNVYMCMACRFKNNKYINTQSSSGSVKIKHARLEDDGLYYCKVTNSEGGVAKSDTVRLTVGMYSVRMVLSQCSLVQLLL